MSGIVERLRGHVADFEEDLRQTLAAKILPDRAAYGEDHSISVGDITAAADHITALEADLAQSEKSHAAARANFLTMQGTAATLLARVKELEAERDAEREACAQVVLTFGPDHYAKHHPGHYRVNSELETAVASAIRARSILTQRTEDNG